MNRQIPIDRSESNPMLMGLMELIKEDNQVLQQKQQEFNQAMNEQPEMKELMEQHKKELLQLQLNHQKKMSEVMKENPEITKLMEEHKKELAELQLRQRQALDKAMNEDAAVVEEMKQQREEINALRIQQQKTLNDKVNETPAVAKYVEAIKESRQALMERQQMLDSEMFKATYLTPVKITPEPTVDEEGNVKLAEGSNVAIQILPLKDNQVWITAFTDNKEFANWSKAENGHTLSMKMQDFFAAVMRDGKISGVIINPLTANLIIPRARIEKMIHEAAGRQGAMAKPKNVEVVEADINE